MSKYRIFQHTTHSELAFYRITSARPHLTHWIPPRTTADHMKA